MDKTNNETMKPITLIVEDFRNDLLNKINESHLPYFIIESVLEKLLEGARNAAITQLNIDRENYNKSLKQGETDECE